MKNTTKKKRARKKTKKSPPPAPPGEASLNFWASKNLAQLGQQATTLENWQRRLAPLNRELVRSGRVMSLIEAARITCDAAGEFELRYHPGDRPKARRTLLKAARLIARAIAHLDKL